MKQKHIVIDARESGTSTGRYIDKLIEHMHHIENAHAISVLTKDSRIEFMKRIAPGFEIVPTKYKEFTFGEQLGFMKQIKALQPDLVHFGMVQQPVLYGGKVVTTMHDLTTIRFRNPAKNPVIFTIKQFVYKWVNKRVAKKSVRIITATEFVKQDIVDYTHIDPNKISITPEAADKITDQSEAIGELTGKQFIMYVGRPLPHKNLERLIDAFGLLQATHPDLQLALIGKKDVLYEQHEQKTNRRGIKNVRFLGFVSEGQLRWLYEHTAAYVFPSLSEGFGLPPLEAMIHGAPVVSSKATCLPEVCGDAAEYFDPSDTKGMAAAIDKVISNEKVRSELIIRGKTQAAKYSWDTTALLTFDIYNEVLHS